MKAQIYFANLKRAITGTLVGSKYAMDVNVVGSVTGAPLPPTSIVTNGDMSANITSAVTTLDGISTVGISFDWTGTPTGDFYIEVCTDYTGIGTGSWSALPFSFSAAGVADVAFADVTKTGAYAIRLRYVRVGGTGTLNATINGKV